jgi:protein involved in polysaccharide export with SLBB domain
LARARDLLRRRLARRGLAPAAGLAALGASESAPAAILRATATIAAQARSGVTLAGMVPARVLELAEGTMRAMMMTKLKVGAAVVLAIGLGVGVMAQQESGGRRPGTSAGRQAEDRPRSSPREPAREGALKTLGEYVIEPPDVLLVEALEALPGRPITGTHLVRPDGTISLGYYGEVYVAGLTLKEAKAKIVTHLQQYLVDEILGLVVEEDDPDDPDKSRRRKVAPIDSERVFVDIDSYNSKHYYVQGEVAQPGRFPVTGGETMLDAINYAGGLLPTAARNHIRLVRPAPPGACCEQIMTVDYEAIAEEGDPTTNYQLLPRDRLIVYRDPEKAEEDKSETIESDSDRRLRAVERRLEQVNRKLDRILDALEGSKRPGYFDHDARGAGDRTPQAPRPRR